MNGSMHGMMNGSMMYGMGWVMMLICLNRPDYIGE